MKDPGLSDRLNKSGAGYRNNNPGNRTGIDSVFGSGTDKGSHTWTKYADWTNGYAGNCLLLLRYLDGSKSSKYGLGSRNPCMLSVIYTWCPPEGNGGESKDATVRYVNNMCRYLGIDSDDRIAITEDNLIKMELVKGMIDSGCVQKNACIAGVKKALEHYKSNGGKLDSNDNIGKDDSDTIKKLKSGADIVSSSSNGSTGSSKNDSYSGSVIGSYTNGNGVFTGSSWGTPVKKENISSADYFVNSKKGRIEGVYVGTHLKQR